jgi:hypothetical protein
VSCPNPESRHTDIQATKAMRMKMLQQSATINTQQLTSMVVQYVYLRAKLVAKNPSHMMLCVADAPNSVSAIL